MPHHRPCHQLSRHPRRIPRRFGNASCQSWPRTAAFGLPKFAILVRFWLLAVLSLASVPFLQAQNQVIIITPHNEAIRVEFARGFNLWHRQRYATDATVEWRDAGGSTDALRFVLSEFSKKPEGINLDCFFGGGLEPFLLLADRKLAQAYRPPAEIMQGIVQNVNGTEIYDAQYRWFGAVVSSFGILQNTRVQGLVGLPRVSRWDQLADPALCGWVGAGDPRNSGTMNTMFETFLQACGWERGWQILTAMGGNVRKFDRISSTTAKDVTLGETAYALAIDFYGFSQIAAAGRTNLTFVLPEDFTAINPDGLAILKGAPNLATAQRFVNFVLSDAGQKLWFLPRGHPDGPQQFSIERMSIRPELYRRYRGISNIEYSPFDLKQTFHYNGDLARERRDVVAALVGTLLVDTHAELKHAWEAIIRRGVTPPDLTRLGRAPVTEAEALDLARGLWKDPAGRNQKKIEWQTWAQKKYRECARTPAPSPDKTF
jgi:iron(III) transport system substrate-binding protein